MMKPDTLEEVTDIDAARARLGTFRQQIRQEANDFAIRLQNAPGLKQVPGQANSRAGKRGENK